MILAREYADAYFWCWVAGSTDFFDGQLARRCGWESRTGAWLDAISDKILLGAIYACFAYNGDVPWWLVGLVLGRDLMILSLALAGLVFTTIRDFPPSIWGKLSTNVQIASAAAILAGPPWLKPWALWACAAATGWSGAHYFYSAVERWRGLGRPAAAIPSGAD